MADFGQGAPCQHSHGSALLKGYKKKFPTLWSQGWDCHTLPQATGTRGETRGAATTRGKRSSFAKSHLRVALSSHVAPLRSRKLGSSSGVPSGGEHELSPRGWAQDWRGQSWSSVFLGTPKPHLLSFATYRPQLLPPSDLSGGRSRRREGSQLTVNGCTVNSWT